LQSLQKNGAIAAILLGDPKDGVAHTLKSDRLSYCVNRLITR